MPTVDELRSTHTKPMHLSDAEWDETLEGLANGRKITAVDVEEVAWAKTPAVGRTFHAAKAQEDEMSKDLQIITVEKRIGLTKDFAAESSKRVDEIAVHLSTVAKTLNDRGGKGEGTACTEDLVDALKAGGYAVLDAASGWFKPITIEKAERADVEKQLADVVEKALAVRRMLAEGDEEEGIADETKGALKELSAALSKMVDEMMGEDKPDDEEKPAVTPQKTQDTGEAADLKKAGEVAAVVGDKLEIMGTKLAELREGLGTLEAEEARAKLDAIDSALWDLRSDYLMLSKAMGVKSGHAIDATAVESLTKRLEDLETRATEMVKSIEETRADVDETAEGVMTLNQTLQAAFEMGDGED